MANLNEIIDLFCKAGLDLKASCFGLWEKSGVSGENPCKHVENMQTPRRETPKPGHEPWTFLL